MSLSLVKTFQKENFEKGLLLDEKIRALTKANQIKKALDQLEETQIFFICIKGFVLSNRLFQDPTIRNFKDVDILVPDRNDVIKLRQKLIEIGWIPVGEDWVEELPRRDWYMDLTMDFGLIEPKSGILFEIHWELDNQILNFSNKEFKEFLPHHLEKMFVLNREVNVLSPELELVYLLAHGAKHAWFRLKWLADIHHYPFHSLDQNKFQVLVEKFKLHRIIAQVHELLKIHFGKNWPLKLEEKASSFMVNYSNQLIETEVLEGAPTALQFSKNLLYNWLITPNKNLAFFRLIKSVGVRPQDISKVDLDAYWKYFIYRYYSLLNRKILKNSG